MSTEKIEMKGATIIRMLVKTKLKFKFKFKEIISARIIANNIEDTYDVSAKGFIKNDIRICERHLIQGKLSTHGDMMSTMLDKVKEHVKDMQSWQAAYTFIDFENCMCTTDIFYKKLNGLKDSKKFEFKF